MIRFVVRPRSVSHLRLTISCLEEEAKYQFKNRDSQQQLQVSENAGKAMQGGRSGRGRDSRHGQVGLSASAGLVSDGFRHALVNQAVRTVALHLRTGRHDAHGPIRLVGLVATHLGSRRGFIVIPLLIRADTCARPLFRLRLPSSVHSSVQTGLWQACPDPCGRSSQARVAMSRRAQSQAPRKLVCRSIDRPPSVLRHLIRVLLVDRSFGGSQSWQ